MNWIWTQLQRLHVVVAIPQLLTLIIVLDVVAYFGGLLYWYGPVMANPSTPMWAWSFIPDCPLFGLFGGLGLLMVTAHKFWPVASQQQAQRYLLVIGGISAILWLSTYLPSAPQAWGQQSATLGVWSGSLLLCGLLFHRCPTWLLALFAFGQIKYGIWTITAWLVFWRNTSLVYGAPLFTFDSVFMTLTHIALVGQGIFLLTYIRPTRMAIIASFAWFAVSDYMDYGLGFYPAIPLQFIPLSIMQWSTIAVTFILTGIYLFLAIQQQKQNHADAYTVTSSESFSSPSV